MNTAKLIAALAVAACVVGPVRASPAEPAPDQTLAQATVTTVLRSSDPDVITAFHRVTVVTPEGEDVDLSFFKPMWDQPLPKPGNVCSFDYRLVRPGADARRLVQRFKCLGDESALLDKLEHATVKAVYRSPVGSGVVKAYHRLVVAVPGEGEPEDLYLLSGSTQDELPAPGDVCSFDYHVGYVSVGRPDRSGDGQIIDRYTCEPAGEALVQTLEQATVKTVERSPFGSGLFAFYHRVAVVTRESEPLDLFSASIGEDDVLPNPGDVCTFDYHVGYVSVARPDKGGDGQIIDRFTCAPAA